MRSVFLILIMTGQLFFFLIGYQFLLSVRPRFYICIDTIPYAEFLVLLQHLQESALLHAAPTLSETASQLIR